MRRSIFVIALGAVGSILLALPGLAAAGAMSSDPASGVTPASRTAAQAPGAANPSAAVPGAVQTAATESANAATTASTTAQAAALNGDPVIAAAGDIACGLGQAKRVTKCHQQETADLLAAGNYDAVLPLGDQQYPCGQLTSFNQVYDPTWGNFNAIAHPIVGDNEYVGKGCSSPGAEGYFTYFGNTASPDQPGCTKNCKGYYSYDIGAWHLVALNSECTQPGVGGCDANDPMADWLGQDLAQHQNSCTLAYWHRPYWGNGSVANKYKGLVQKLYDGGVELLLVGHNHVYTRHAAQDPNSNLDANGVREFIVGTGGYSHSGLNANPLPHVEQRNNTTFGVLELTLHPNSYDFEFVADTTSGSYTDSGTNQPCHGGAGAPQAPSATTDPATNVTQTDATLNGTVNPNGTDTTYHFEYGSTASYGTSTATTSAGSGTTNVTATATIGGLSPATTYHYRVVATSSAGTTNGNDRTFITQSPGGGCAAGSVTATDSGDTFVYIGLPAKNYGDDLDLRAKSVGTASERTMFLDFATPAIPAGCTVTGATLTMVSDEVATGQQSITVHDQDPATWDESGLTWSNQPPRGPTVASNLMFNLQSVGQQQNFSLPGGSWIELDGTTSISITSSTSAPKLFRSREVGASVAPVLRIDYA